jgi:AcrR family transcriptional regulator
MTKAKQPQSAHLQRQREKILSVVGRLFWEKGYLATSVDEIADVAKVNKASIYYYFPNKAAILYEIALMTMRALIDQAVSIVDSNLEIERKIEAFVSNHVRFSLNHLGFSGIGQMERRNLPPKLLRTYVSLRDEYEGIFRKMLEEGMEQGRFRLKSSKLTSLFILGFLNSFFQWFRPTGKLSSEEIASEACVFISNALIPEVLRIEGKGRQDKVLKATH